MMLGMTLRESRAGLRAYTLMDEHKTTWNCFTACSKRVIARIYPSNPRVPIRSALGDDDLPSLTMSSSSDPDIRFKLQAHHSMLVLYGSMLDPKLLGTLIPLTEAPILYKSPST